jgi:hypothetical protein
VAFLLHVADERFDGGSATQLAFDDAEDAALLSGDEDAARMWRVVPAVSLIDVDPLDLATGEALCVLEDGPQCVAVVGIARQRCRVQHELAARRSGVGGHDRDLYAELPGRPGLAFADAFELWGMEGIELPAALTLALRADLGGPRERALEGRLDGLAPEILRRISRISRPNRVRRKRICRWWRLNCLAWA